MPEHQDAGGEELLRAGEVERLLKVTRRTLYKWDAREYLVAVKINARTWRWRRSDINRIMNGGSVASAG